MNDSNEEERLWLGPLPATRVRKLPLEAVIKPTLPQELLARQKRLKFLLGHQRIVAVCSPRNPQKGPSAQWIPCFLS